MRAIKLKTENEIMDFLKNITNAAGNLVKTTANEVVRAGKERIERAAEDINAVAEKTKTDGLGGGYLEGRKRASAGHQASQMADSMTPKDLEAGTKASIATGVNLFVGDLFGALLTSSGLGGDSATIADRPMAGGGTVEPPTTQQQRAEAKRAAIEAAKEEATTRVRDKVDAVTTRARDHVHVGSPIGLEYNGSPHVEHALQEFNTRPTRENLRDALNAIQIERNELRGQLADLQPQRGVLTNLEDGIQRGMIKARLSQLDQIEAQLRGAGGAPPAMLPPGVGRPDIFRPGCGFHGSGGGIRLDLPFNPRERLTNEEKQIAEADAEIEKALNNPNLAFEDLVFILMKSVMKSEQASVKQQLREARDTASSDRAARDVSRDEIKGLEGQLKTKLADFGKAKPEDQAKMKGSIDALQLDIQSKREDLSNTTSDKADSRAEVFENLKNAMQKLTEMQQAMSNILNNQHQTAMSTIGNIR
jgi:hypothetical protein